MAERQLANDKDKDKTERVERGTAQFVFLSVGKKTKGRGAIKRGGRSGLERERGKRTKGHRTKGREKG